ncbi:MAG: right-handed parallel beta-helix repeat-containing protein [Proteobacteria bacterium]|nr:right-handed parallel beta-helix repeat-containing protein [Pseudomonadota bacterium]MBU1739417.1 right-handed parallel beta-helix repeat-containing protein [Pseudomonadota bacterium]
MKIKRILFLGFLVYQALTANLWAATYYVDNAAPNTSDTNPGTIQEPWRNCPGMVGWAGTATLAPGDVVKFNSSSTWKGAGGNALLEATGGVTYDGSSWGTGVRATLQAVGSFVRAIVSIQKDDPVIATVVQGFNVNGNGTSNSGMTVNWPSSVNLTGAVKRIENCDVHDLRPLKGGAARYGIKVGAIGGDTCKNVEILNTRVHDISTTGIAIYPAVNCPTCLIENVTIRGCTVGPNISQYDTWNGTGIIFKNNQDNVLLENSEIFDAVLNNVIIQDDGSGAPQKLTIRHNLIHNGPSHGITVQTPTTTIFDVYGNVIYGNGKNGIEFSTAIKGSSNRVKIYNNTLYQNTGGEINFSSSSATYALLEIKNNILYSVSGQTPLRSALGNIITAHSNNLYYRPGGGTLATVGGTSYTSLADTPTYLLVFEKSASLTDPKFVDPVRGVYSIAAGSGAIGTGVDLGFPLLNPASSWPGNIILSSQDASTGYAIGAYTAPLAQKTLMGLKVDGPGSVEENGTATYTATAIWSDGSTSAVTPEWSVSSAYAKVSIDGVVTTSSVVGDQAMTVSAGYAYGGIAKTAAMTVTIIKVPPALSGLKIDGPGSLEENGTGTYTATATWSDGSTSVVTPLWSENSAYATISADGVMTASTVPSDQIVTVSADFTADGVTKTAAIEIGITKVAISLSGLKIIGPLSVNESSSGIYAATATWSDGSTTVVTPLWSENSSYAMISTIGVLTTSAVPSDQIVTVGAGYTADGITKAASLPVSITKVTLSLSGLKIDGPTSVNENSSGTYTARATWSDGSATTVTPLWSENSTYASISSAGVLTTLSVPSDQSVTVTAGYSSGGVTKTASLTVSITKPSSGAILLFRAEAGTFTPPTMEIATAPEIPGGSYITPTVSNSGSAVYDFNITRPGTYKIVGEVYSANAASDSFRVKIDDAPEDIWDLNPEGNSALYNVWRQDEVTARGTGTFAAPQFDPLRIQLAEGPHTITISGRELNSRLAYFYLVMGPGSTELIEAESGKLTLPMKVATDAGASGGACIETTTSDSGSAVFTFDIAQPGTYKVLANTYAADSGTDSFLVSVDNGPEDIWDLNPQGDPALYNVWRQDEVTARGDGSFKAPQYDPMTVQLESGPHTITFSGREVNTRLDNFYLRKISTETEVTGIKID